VEKYEEKREERAPCNAWARSPHISTKRCRLAGRKWQSRLDAGLWDMTRVMQFNSPFLLGFDALERMLERAAKASDGYPPYNVEQLPTAEGEALRITLAVAGFSREELSVTVEENHLVIRGRQLEEEERTYLHRGIAARQFQRSFVLADGIEVKGARLENGLLVIDLEKPEPARTLRTIEIAEDEPAVPARRVTRDAARSPATE
jgi:HSP20 family molecular chaperone IbpA